MKGTDLGRKHEARERAVVLLYEAESRGMSPIDLLAQLPVAPEPYATELIEGIVGQADFLDEQISRYAKGWTIERMPMIDRIVLRLGIYELAAKANVPRAAVISEAVELASQYSTDTSARFVNGMMARIGGIVRDDAGRIVVELPEPSSIEPTPKAPEPESVRKSSTVVRSGGFEGYFVERDHRREREREREAEAEAAAAAAAAMALALAEAAEAAKAAELDLDDDEEMEQSVLDDLAVLDDTDLDDTVAEDAEVVAYQPTERPAIETEVTEEELRSVREEGTAPRRDADADDDDFDLEFL